MAKVLPISKADARRALVRHHFELCTSIEDAFLRLKSIQFDPIAPVGCNHDLVLQARVPGYQIGDWQSLAYQHRKIYDGWDKQACLIQVENWPSRRLYHAYYRSLHPKILNDFAYAIDAILDELRARGPLLPREFEFQERKEEWKGSWHGPNLTKQVLRALWHVGEVMTADRRGGHHVYDLTERVLPAQIHTAPAQSLAEYWKAVVLDRHKAMGLLRPSAPQEVWAISKFEPSRQDVIRDLADSGQIVPVDVEGMKLHATPEFLKLLDLALIEPRVTFVAPLDQFMWDRKMIAHLFGFDYIWEIYVPEVKRRWGYYVLPVLYGDQLVARIEFWCRSGVLEVKRWIPESDTPVAGFDDAMQSALSRFRSYCCASTVKIDPSVSGWPKSWS